MSGVSSRRPNGEFVVEWLREFARFDPFRIRRAGWAILD